MDDLIDIAIRLNFRIELHRQVRSQFSRHRAEYFDSSTPRVPETSGGVESMQVGRICFSAKEQQRRLFDGLCLYCGGHGHLAAYFPVKANSRQ